MQIVIRVRIPIKPDHPYTKLREAAAIVRGSFYAEFRQLGADEMMNFNSRRRTYQYFLASRLSLIWPNMMARLESLSTQTSGSIVSMQPASSGVHWGKVGYSERPCRSPIRLRPAGLDGRALLLGGPAGRTLQHLSGGWPAQHEHAR